MTLANITVHQVEFELEFNSQAQAHAFQKEHHQYWYNDVLKLIEQHLAPYNRQNTLVIEKIELHLPSIHASSFNTQLSDAVELALSEFVKNTDVLLGREALTNLDEAVAPINAQQTSRDIAKTQAGEVHAHKAAHTSTTQATSQHTQVQSQNELSAQQRSKNEALVTQRIIAQFMDMAQQPGREQEAFSGLLNQVLAHLHLQTKANTSANTSTDASTLVNAQQNAEISAEINAEISQSNTVLAQSAVLKLIAQGSFSENARTALAGVMAKLATPQFMQVLNALEQSQKQALVKWLNETISAKGEHKSKLTSTENAITPKATARAFEQLSTHHKQDIYRSLFTRMQTRATASSKAENKAYFQDILHKLIQKAPSEIAEQAFLNLIIHQPKLLIDLINQPIQQSQLLRLCQRLNNENLVQVCNTLSAQYALGTPESALNFCRANTGPNRAIGWLHLIQYLSLEGLRVENNDAALHYIQHALTGQQEDLSDKGLFDDGNVINHPPLAQNVKLIEQLNNEQFIVNLSFHDYLANNNAAALIKTLANNPHQSMLWCEQLVRLPIHSMLQAAKAQGFTKSLDGVQSLINLYAQFIDQHNKPLQQNGQAMPAQYKSMPSLLAASEQFSIAQIRLYKKAQHLAQQASNKGHNKANKLALSSKQIKHMPAVYKLAFMFDALMQLVKYHYIQLGSPQRFSAKKVQWWWLKYEANSQAKSGIEAKTTSKLSNNINTPKTEPTAKQQTAISAEQTHTQAPNKTTNAAAMLRNKQEQITDRKQALITQPLSDYLHSAAPNINTFLKMLGQYKAEQKQALLLFMLSPNTLNLLVQHFSLLQLYAISALFTRTSLVQSKSLLSVLSLLSKRLQTSISLPALHKLEWHTLMQYHAIQGLRFNTSWLTKAYLNQMQEQQPTSYNRLVQHHTLLLSNLFSMAKLEPEQVSNMARAIIEHIDDKAVLSATPKQNAAQTQPPLNEQSQSTKQALNKTLTPAQSQNNEPAMQNPTQQNQQESFEGLYAQYAGLVLLHPYINRLFDALELTHAGQFKNHESCLKARILLVYLASGNSHHEPSNMAFINILCGLDANFMPETSFTFELLQPQINIVESLLLSVIDHWNIGNTSIAALRDSFLMRFGTLQYQGQDFLLNVEQASYDMLLERLPWQITNIKLPWQPKMINVSWR